MYRLLWAIAAVTASSNLASAADGQTVVMSWLQPGADDGFHLLDCRITNAVRCVPPQNKPTPKEIATCRQFLVARTRTLRHLRTLLAIGRIAHDSVVATLGERVSRAP